MVCPQNLKQRTILQHTAFDGKVYPCFASGCDFGHSDNPDLELVVFKQHEQRLLDGIKTCKPGQGRYDKWRLDHAARAQSFQRAAWQGGAATYDVSMKTQQVPDTLRANTLNLLKPWWSHG